MSRPRWWKERCLPRQTSQQTALPNLQLPSALDFDARSFTSTSKYGTSSSLEQVITHPTHSYVSLGSDISTLNPYTLTSFDFTRRILPKKSQGSDFILPSRLYRRFLLQLRYAFLTVYRRLFTVVFIANMLPLLITCKQDSIKPSTLATAASTNFVAAILIRQDFIINAIFRTAWLVPWIVPLRIRRVIARCYCYGGLHSAGALAGTLWWLAFSVLLAMKFVEEGVYTVPILTTTLVILGLLVVIMVLALPAVREKWHDTFEITHRFLGWGSVFLFWVQLVLMSSHECTSATSSNVQLLDIPADALSTVKRYTGSCAPFNIFQHLLMTPTFWSLTLISTIMIYPWLRLRKWTFTPEILSAHAVRLHFNQPVHKFSCLSISISPLREWHPFATFPSVSTTTAFVDNKKRECENSLIISSAGNWTASVIRDAQATQKRSALLRSTVVSVGKPRERGRLSFYIKGHPRHGVLSLTLLFPRVMLLTTGSGIGPALSSLLLRPPSQNVRLVWSTRSPIQTYGAEICCRVLEADPQAVIIDTDAIGRPDLVEVGYKVWEEMRAEAVFVLSNKAVTKRVVHGLEGRGVLCFGPIWDS